MTDTCDKIRKLVREKMMQRSGAERMRIGSQMHETARKIVLASAKKELSEEQKKIFLFERFYGNDFNAEETRKIREYFKKLEP